MCQGNSKRATHAPRLPGQHALPHSNMLLPPLATLLPSPMNSNNNMQNVMQPGWLCPFKHRCHPPPHGEPPTCRSAPSCARAERAQPVSRARGPRVERESQPEHIVVLRLRLCLLRLHFVCSSAPFGSPRHCCWARACLGCLALWVRCLCLCRCRCRCRWLCCWASRCRC